MIESNEDWLTEMAKLEAEHAISAGGSPGRETTTPQAFDADSKDWLSVMTELEGGISISAGGGPFRAILRQNFKAASSEQDRATRAIGRNVSDSSPGCEPNSPVSAS